MEMTIGTLSIEFDEMDYFNVVAGNGFTKPVYNVVTGDRITSSNVLEHLETAICLQ
jgi:hypothetical protein